MLLAYRFLFVVHASQAATLNAASGGTEQDIQHLQWPVSMCTLSLQVEVCPTGGAVTLAAEAGTGCHVAPTSRILLIRFLLQCLDGAVVSF